MVWAPPIQVVVIIPLDLQKPSAVAAGTKSSTPEVLIVEETEKFPRALTGHANVLNRKDLLRSRPPPRVVAAQMDPTHALVFVSG